MSITATELKQNLGKYLLLSAQEDVYITKNGKVMDRVSTAQSLFGILPQEADIDISKEERLAVK